MQGRLWLSALIGSAALGLVVLRGRSNFSFSGRAVLITGARGLGLELARRLAQQGARLMLIARDAEELKRAETELRRFDVEVHAEVCDVSDKGAVQRAVQDTVKRFGGLDVLINNAGIIQVGPALHMKDSDFEAALAVHFWGPLHAITAVVPQMQKQGGGRIVNIASVGGKVAVPHLAPYSASKFALVGLSDALRAELRPLGIRVTTVAPTLMRTGSHLHAVLKGQAQKEFVWFAVSASAPLIAMSSERAAKRILDACRRGTASLDLGWSGRTLIILNAVAPKLFGHLMAVVNRLLPGPMAAEIGDVPRTGWESRSRWAPSLLTRLGDRAAVHNQQLGGRTEAELHSRS